MPQVPWNRCLQLPVQQLLQSRHLLQDCCIQQAPPERLGTARDEGRSGEQICLPQGYETQGNEHSWFMLISSAFMLNGAEAPGQFVIHPWVASSNNQPSTAAQLRGVTSHLTDTCLSNLAYAHGLLQARSHQ